MFYFGEPRIGALWQAQISPQADRRERREVQLHEGDRLQRRRGSENHMPMDARLPHEPDSTARSYSCQWKRVG
jgi:hypothetical protein